MSSKSYMQPLDANFVKEGQAQRDKEKRIEDQQDKTDEASEEDKEVKFKPRGKEYSEALEKQEKRDTEEDAVDHQEQTVSDKHAMKHQEMRNLDRNAMNLHGRGWGAVTHNKNTLEYDPDGKWEESGEAEKEAWKRKRKGQGYENR